MQNNHAIVDFTLATALADGGTQAVSYPSGTTEGEFAGGRDHRIVALQHEFKAPKDFHITFGDASFTINWNAAATLAAGTPMSIQLDRPGDSTPVMRGIDDTLYRAKRTAGVDVVRIGLGTAATADVNGVFEAVSQAAGSITLDGALATDGVVTFDVPRNIVVDSGGADTAVLTFTGTDEYGQAMVEAITLNGTTAVSGKKAFKTITACTNSATIANGAFAGPGDVLGLPIFVGSDAEILVALEDGVAATAPSFVAGSTVEPTATSADVRGTVEMDGGADGSLTAELIVAVADRDYIGGAQYAG